MLHARVQTLATLRQAIRRIEAPEAAAAVPRVALGHAAADERLQGGLAPGALHEVFAEAGRHNPAATGFAAGVAARLAAGRPQLWVRQDFIAREQGALSLQGLAELGLDPRRVITVQVADVAAALRVAADGLACAALGTVVLDLWGESRQLDLVASRKLTLAAQASGVSCLLLRTAAVPMVSTAETRWVVRSVASGPAGVGGRRMTAAASLQLWGMPVLEAALVRNRHGRTGQWIMEWNCHECLFREPATHSQPAPAVASDRPAAPADGVLRRAG
jgi:protein ImuA